MSPAHRVVLLLLPAGLVGIVFVVAGHAVAAAAAAAMATAAVADGRRRRALRATEARLALVLSTLGEGVCVFEPDGRVTLVNARGRELLGVREDDDAVSAFDPAWHHCDEHGRPLAPRDLPAAHVARTGEPVEGVLTGLTRGDGAFRWFRSTARALPGDGPPYSVAVSFDDVTAEREAEARYRTVVEQLEEGVILQDRSFRIATSNPAAERILGLTRDQLEGRTSLDPRWRALHADGSPWPGEDHPAPVALRTGEAQLDQLMGVRKPDGTLTWIVVNARPLATAGGAAAGSVVCSFSDVTASVRQRAELEDAEEVARLGSWQLDLAGPGAYSASAGLRRLLGLPADLPDEAVARTEAVVEEDRERVAAHGRAALATGADQDFLFRARRADDGRIVTLHGRIHAERDGDEVIRLHGTLQDVTEQRAGERALAASEARFRGLAEHAPVAILETDPAGLCAWVNGAWEEMAGLSLPEAVGEGWRAAVHPEDRGRIEAAWAQAARSTETIPVEYRIGAGGGHARVAMGTVAALHNPAGEVTGLISVAVDVTASREAERMRAEAERHFRSAFHNAPIGVAVISLDGYYLGVNRAMSDLTGYPEDKLEGMPLATVAHPEDAARDAEALRGLLAGEGSTHQSETRLIHAGGTTVWASVTATLVRDEDGRPTHFIAQIQDITERRRYEQRLQYMADHDPLTGLLNRRSFERELDRHVARVDRYGDQGAVVVLDVDHFKTINDTLGHNEGDKVIVAIAHALRSRLRESDIIARLGGDEFAVLLPTVDEAEARTVAEDLREVVGAQVLPGARRSRSVTASIGVVAARQREGLTGEDLLVCADLAMYDAKDAGRNRVAVYATSPHDHARTEARMAWVERIRDALEGDDFVLHAQPIVDLGTGLVSQYELLLRMRAADGDLIPPGTFLYIAERYDLIQELDRWVMTRAIELLARARAAGRPLTLEVNVSGKSLGDPAVLATIERELRRTGARPSDLVIEITETAAVSNIPQAQAFGTRLSELGCRFALDDFGAGFGSFYYLKHLPFDVLKIDGEFIRNCRANPVDRLVIESVVTIARGMGKRTVAEFVQDDETVALLRDYGVDYAQGYHLGRPTGLPEVLAIEGVPAA